MSKVSIIKDRDGNEYKNKVLLSQRFLYHTFFGRLILKQLIKPSFSLKTGKKLDSKKSVNKAYSFAKKNNINLDDYILDNINSFNDFFSRKIKPGKRRIDYNPSSLISPCDSKLMVYRISSDFLFEVKNSIYSVEELLQNKNLAKQYEDGYCLVFRLCVDDYHRYCYIDDGDKEKNIFIPGFLHTVNPIAFDKYKVFLENQREYTILHTKNFDDVVQIEVGALMVGKIDNYHQKHKFKRAEEKGRFLYGGSTIILLLNKNIKIDDDILLNSQNDIETIVKYGEKIGTKIDERKS